MSLSGLPVVYVDESSNSGENLLDPNQPVFTVAGVHLPDDAASATVAEVRSRLPTTQGEPKYGSLARAGRGREALLWAFAQLPPDSVRVYVVHKRFMVITKLVDLLVEPLAHADGFNLYEDDQALGLANMLHACGPVFGDQAAYDRLLQAFVDWMRKRVTTDDFFTALWSFKATVADTWFIEWVELLELCREVADETAADIASGTVKDSLDPAVPSLYCLGLDFGTTLGRFRLVHDESKVISRNTALLRAIHLLPDPARPGQFMEQLRAIEIDFADSTAHPQLQLADWAAGAVRQWATQMALDTHNPFAEQLKPVVEPWLIGAIWPSTHTEQE
ncbi:uncharacterized protein DUF3800 [Nocardiopsis sp. Huas11]|uniref:DUF3800 domain-containing protein n=1 Tax=Nocardiopsis sp. Huas11 TaxID=2183912 RepID=UPI000EADBBF7|nr:DUF3800 domain-containing protein [Nocardiopsis sp. Huas11]RKS05986.1 uncharacterized protein DUF3800 [Nocardiopsis sp. Huas11]